jgi:hypothetical protein
MNTAKFREELRKAMPWYKWTVHRQRVEWRLKATGTQSSGFNRLSTLRVVRTVRNGIADYKVKSSGYGTSAPWLSDHRDSTLLRALRGLQDYYESMARLYGSHASALQAGRRI